jgi:sulfatase maturation enzyme AslB (radical SAM superfamily)
MQIDRFSNMKLLAHADRLLAIAAGGEPYPVDWHVYPSNVCNHKCTWCMFRQNGEQFDFRVILPREVLLRAVRDAARTGARLMHFSGGGEPLINKATPEAMELAQSLGLKVALSTNGRLLTPEIAGLVDYIRVSLNAGTPEQHHATNHGGDPSDKGDWHVILENIARAAPYARRDFGLGYVVDYENYQDIYAFCSVAARLFGGSNTADRQRFVHIRPGFYYEAEKDAKTRAVMPLAHSLCVDAKRDFGDVIDIYSISEKFDGYWTPRTYDRCLAVWSGTTLRATGDFAVCQDRTDLVWGKSPSYKAGATFEECWHSEERRAVVARIHAGGELDRCPRCVWNNRNYLINALGSDSIRLDLV